MRWLQFQSMRMCCSAAAACWRGSMEDARLAAGGCPVTEESWRLGLAPPLEAGHKSRAVAVSPSVLSTPVSPYPHYLQWPSLTSTRYVSSLSSVHSCSSDSPNQRNCEALGSSRPYWIVSQCWGHVFTSEIWDILPMLCHVILHTYMAWTSKMSLSNQKRELWTCHKSTTHADIFQAPTHINMLWKCGYIWWPKETELWIAENWYTSTSGKVIFHGIQEMINMNILFSEWPFGTTKCNEAPSWIFF